MTDTTPSAHSAIRVLAALAELGEATAAAVAEHAGLGYSTATPKLRTWENTGQAERVRTDDGRTLWRLTAAGRAATATADSPPDPATTPAVESDTDAAPETTAEPAATEQDSSTQPNGPDQSDVAVAPDTDETAASAEAATAQPGTADVDTPAGDVDAAEADAKAEADAPPAAADDQPDIDTAAGDVPPQDGLADPPAAADRADQPDSAPPAPPAPTAPGEQPAAADEDKPTPVRRSPGSMRAAIEGIFRAYPDRQLKVGELCRLIDEANTGTDAKKASQGAVYNATTKLAAAGTLTQTVERPATFQLTRSST